MEIDEIRIIHYHYQSLDPNTQSKRELAYGRQIREICEVAIKYHDMWKALNKKMTTWNRGK
jgi:hypothetical protein